MKLLAATNTGLTTAVPDDSGWRVTAHGLNGRHVTSVIAHEGVVLAGTTEGVYRSEDQGQSWSESSAGLNVRHVRWLAFHPNVLAYEVAGTEPAAVFFSRDGGANWQEQPEVAELRNSLGWWLPYSPEAGCVRGFAFHGHRAYAAVEVGGVLRSDDGGQRWRLVNGRNETVHADVHSVAVHPSSEDVVFAPTGGGFFVSQDGGTSWQALYRNCYVRAVWVDPTDMRRMILGPSEGPSGQNGRLEVTHDGGLLWQKTAVSWSRNMVERFKAQPNPANPPDTDLFAVLANGELLQTRVPAGQPDLASLQWTQVLAEVPRINDVTTLADG